MTTWGVRAHPSVTTRWAGRGRLVFRARDPSGARFSMLRPRPFGPAILYVAPATLRARDSLCCARDPSGPRDPPPWCGGRRRRRGAASGHVGRDPQARRRPGARALLRRPAPAHGRSPWAGRGPRRHAARSGLQGAGFVRERSAVSRLVSPCLTLSHFVSPCLALSRLVPPCLALSRVSRKNLPGPLVQDAPPGDAVLPPARGLGRAGLVPAIHAPFARLGERTWMPATRACMSRGARGTGGASAHAIRRIEKQKLHFGRRAFLFHHGAPPVPPPCVRAGEGMRRRHHRRSPSALRRGGGQGEQSRAARRPGVRGTTGRGAGRLPPLRPPRVPCGGGRPSRSARRTVRMRAKRMLRIMSITGTNGSSPIALPSRRQGPNGRISRE